MRTLQIEFVRAGLFPLPSFLFLLNKKPRFLQETGVFPTN
ncbi:hypothetical protein AVDCRST_MAG84-1424 [uncultured Microcoleus sp.]|uniref:Uncharacterized protein n=1 Tax=uncultured Microcoleus sp. TaxID=259945 RepID=A0A6J4L4S1_9CYAN|nr:hypothetical protein AVDCRST_MAG84-1424 [uncultured Microcoleus sp.]